MGTTGILFSCLTTQELVQHYRSESLGGETRLEIQQRLVFLQTFPYSGVNASHLYVYGQHSSGLEFLGLLRLPSHGLELNRHEDDAVEVLSDGRRVATFASPSAKP